MYCENCGALLSEGARFCASCGATLKKQLWVTSSKADLTNSCSNFANKQCKTGTKMWLILVYVLLIFIGTGYIALAMAGRVITARVTGYEQILMINNDDSTRNPSRYKLDYEFAVNGKRYTGSVTRVFKAGSHMRQTISVRYLPFWPHMNSEDSGGVSPVGFIIILTGISLLVFELKRKNRRGNIEK